MSDNQSSVITKQNFKVSIDGLQDENFISFSDISATSQAIEETGGADKFAKMHPGKVKYEPITLVRSYKPKDKFFQNWEKEGKTKNVSIIFNDVDGQEVSRFNLQKASINGRSISGGDSSAGNISTEQITLVFETGEWQ